MARNPQLRVAGGGGDLVEHGAPALDGQALRAMESEARARLG
jgi:hypothetical protein